MENQEICKLVDSNLATDSDMVNVDGMVTDDSNIADVGDNMTIIDNEKATDIQFMSSDDEDDDDFDDDFESDDDGSLEDDADASMDDDDDDEYDEGEDNGDDRDFAIIDEYGDSGEEQGGDYETEMTSEEEELTEEEIQKLIDDGVDITQLSNKTSSSSSINNICSKTLIDKCPFQNEYGKLPPNWIEITHGSGISLYLHKPTRVTTVSRPYLLGPGSIKKHKLQIDSIPCLAYKKYLENKYLIQNNETQIEDKNSNDIQMEQKGTTGIQIEKECVNKTQSSEEITHIQDKDTQIENTITNNTEIEQNRTNDTQIREKSKNTSIEKEIKVSRQIEASENRNPINHDKAIEYFRKLFKFKKVNIRKFQSWKMKRAYVHKQKCQNKRIRKSNNKTVPQTIVIPVPVYNARTKTMITQEWSLNPKGKSSVCILHEYLQRAIRMKPAYKYKELEHALTPYQATIKLNGMMYGSGIGSSKKQAKIEAAKATLEILIPQLKNIWLKKGANTSRLSMDVDKYLIFDKIKITDSRIAEFCAESTEPSPYAMLLSCLNQNFGLDESAIKCTTTPTRKQILFKMEFNKYSSSVICNSKKEGKQLCSQYLLQDLHPQVHYWGSLLRLYGNIINGVRKKQISKQNENDENENSNHLNFPEIIPKRKCRSPNWEILSQLRNEMGDIYKAREYLLDIGKSKPTENFKQLFPINIDDGFTNPDHQINILNCNEINQNCIRDNDHSISETNDNYHSNGKLNQSIHETIENDNFIQEIDHPISETNDNYHSNGKLNQSIHETIENDNFIQEIDHSIREINHYLRDIDTPDREINDHNNSEEEICSFESCNDNSNGFPNGSNEIRD